MKKRYLLFCQLALLPTLAVRAQFVAETDGFYINADTDVYIDGLFMRPSSPVEITENSLEVEEDAVPGNPPGILRIYRLSSPIDFSGMIGFNYLDSELNGNTPGLLELFYGEGSTFTPTSGSNNATPNRIFNTLSGVTFSAVSAGQQNALPVALTDFYLERTENTTVLRWQTSLEKNSDHFEIQQSSNIQHWNVIGKVNAAGHSATLASYSFSDPAKRQGIQYYRIKMVDKDGSFEFSPIRSIQLDALAGIQVYPNPVVDRFYVDAGEKVSRLKLTDLSGRTVLELSKPQPDVNLSAYPTGIYLAEIITQSGQRKLVKILKK